MVLNFAHRGSLTEAPENTVAAMKKALGQGAKGIELDVRLTRDNQLVLIHDHHLKRFNKRAKKNVVDYTLKEIKQIDIGSVFSKEFSQERLATLDEVLEVIPKNIMLNIEVKNTPIIHEKIEAITIDCLHNHRRTENIILSSFDHQSLERIQRLEPNIPIGLLFEQRILRPWEYAENSGLDVYSLHPSKIHVDEAFIAKSHQAGYAVYPYTVNELKQYEQLLAWGVEGVFSNNPAIFGM